MNYIFMYFLENFEAMFKIAKEKRAAELKIPDFSDENLTEVMKYLFPLMREFFSTCKVPYLQSDIYIWIGNEFHFEVS